MTVMLSRDTIDDTVKVALMREVKLDRLVEEFKKLIDRDEATKEQVQYYNFLCSILGH